MSGYSSKGLGIIQIGATLSPYYGCVGFPFDISAQGGDNPMPTLMTARGIVDVEGEGDEKVTTMDLEFQNQMAVIAVKSPRFPNSPDGTIVKALTLTSNEFVYNSDDESYSYGIVNKAYAIVDGYGHFVFRGALGLDASSDIRDTDMAVSSPIKLTALSKASTNRTYELGTITSTCVNQTVQDGVLDETVYFVVFPNSGLYAYDESADEDIVTDVGTPALDFSAKTKYYYTLEKFNKEIYAGNYYYLSSPKFSGVKGELSGSFQVDSYGSSIHFSEGNLVADNSGDSIV